MEKRRIGEGGEEYRRIGEGGEEYRRIGEGWEEKEKRWLRKKRRIRMG